MTERLARVAARHPKRMVALWVVIFVLSVAAIALLLPSAITTDSRVTSKPESERGYELMGERLPRSDEFVNEIVLVRAPGRDVTTDVQVRRAVEGLARRARGDRAGRAGDHVLRLA